MLANLWLISIRYYKSETNVCFDGNGIWKCQACILCFAHQKPKLVLRRRKRKQDPCFLYQPQLITKQDVVRVRNVSTSRNYWQTPQVSVKILIIKILDANYLLPVFASKFVQIKFCKMFFIGNVDRYFSAYTGDVSGGALLPKDTEITFEFNIWTKYFAIFTSTLMNNC